MSTVQEIEAAIPRLSRTELEQLRAWFEEYLEDQLELTEEVKSKLEESRREIAHPVAVLVALPCIDEEDARRGRRGRRRRSWSPSVASPALVVGNRSVF